MQAQDVQDVILLNTLLAVSKDTPILIARLIDWKNGVDYDEDDQPSKPAGAGVKPDGTPTSREKAKRAKPTQHTAKGSDRYEPTPDPSESSDSEPDF